MIVARRAEAAPQSIVAAHLCHALHTQEEQYSTVGTNLKNSNATGTEGSGTEQT
jgi:hypothetical protein